MDEINPYATPGSALSTPAPAPGRLRGYGWYKGCSLVYGVFFGIACLALLYQRVVELSPIGVLVLLVILAPVISYLLVAVRSARLFYAWLSLHLLSLLMLLAFAVERAGPEGGFKAGFALFMFGCSLVSWLASLYFHWRLGKN